MSVAHMNIEDVEIAGYIIPKNSMVIGFLATAHLDPKLFPQPHRFKPERFLNEFTGKLAPQDGFIPFSLGSYIIRLYRLKKTTCFSTDVHVLYTGADLEIFK